MRRLLRIILWMVKGVLLLIALAALLMWPVSEGRWMWLTAQSRLTGPQWGEECWRRIGCWDGFAVLRVGRVQHNPKTIPSWVPVDVTAGGPPKWREWGARARPWSDRSWPGKWYPLRWCTVTWNESDERVLDRAFAVPLWLVALVAGTWPLASIALALRRRAKRRRAAREGLCKHCGYDLRATPAAGGALLAICPECGKETSAGNKPSPPT